VEATNHAEQGPVPQGDGLLGSSIFQAEACGNAVVRDRGGRLLSRRKQSDCENRNVVVLAESLSSKGNGLSKLVADRRGALKAEEFAAFVAGFDDTVGQQRQPCSLFQTKFGFGVGDGCFKTLGLSREKLERHVATRDADLDAFTAHYLRRQEVRTLEKIAKELAEARAAHSPCNSNMRMLFAERDRFPLDSPAQEAADPNSWRQKTFSEASTGGTFERQRQLLASS